MPSVSESQRKLFCIALSIKKGETPKNYSAQAAKLAEGNSEEALSHYCEEPVKE